MNRIQTDIGRMARNVAIARLALLVGVPLLLLLLLACVLAAGMLSGVTQAWLAGALPTSAAPVATPTAVHP